RVAVDHDRFVPGLAQREAGVDAAVIELDALPDPVRTTAENDDLATVAGVGLVLRLAEGRRFVGRIHVRRDRLELGGAAVDALEYREHPETMAQRAHFIF